MLKHTIAALVALSTCVGTPVLAQGLLISEEALPAPQQPEAVALPVAAGAADEEYWFQQVEAGERSWQVRNITVPTLVPVRPVGAHTGAAMIVAPGGGFLGLAIEKEGWDVARWLANRGVTAFVLKYRVLPTPVDQPTFAAELTNARSGGEGMFRPPDDTPAQSLADGLSALRHVREHVAEFGIDPERVGFMGFSAGGFLTRSVIEHGGENAPDFAAPIYPNMAPMVVPADAPPMFVVIAADDFLLAPHEGLPLLESYREADKPIEFHLLSGGGHGFGLGREGEPTEGWPDMMWRWMRSIGVLEAGDD